MILFETSLIKVAIQVISVVIMLVVYGRMFEIYVYFVLLQLRNCSKKRISKRYLSDPEQDFLCLWEFRVKMQMVYCPQMNF